MKKLSCKYKEKKREVCYIIAQNVLGLGMPTLLESL